MRPRVSKSVRPVVVSNVVRSCGGVEICVVSVLDVMVIIVVLANSVVVSEVDPVEASGMEVELASGVVDVSDFKTKLRFFE